MKLSSAEQVEKSNRFQPCMLLAFALLAQLPLAGHALAQDMSFGLDEVDEEGEGEGAAEGQGEAGAEGDAEAGAQGGAAVEAGGEAEAGGDDFLSDLTGEGEEEGLGGEEGAAKQREAPKEAKEEVYAIQRIYALRSGRFELIPSLAFTVNDPYVSHPALSIGMNYWITNVLAVGANFLWYQGLESESDLNFHIRRSFRLAVPITEYQLGAHLNFTYVPIYGKFSMFNESIFQWDSYLVGGVGFLRTRPVAVVDPAIRTFDFDMRVAFNLGLGIRVFVTRWLTIFGELRDYLYLEQLESLQVALGDAREDPETWLQDESTLTHNFTIHLGATIYLPFDFEYEKPK